MTKIAVLGCGPAGLLVAHAVALAGHTPVIYSKKVKSPIGGAQFLHQAIPELTLPEPDGEVNFCFVGSQRGYAQKVYKNPMAEVSWGNYESGQHPVWNLRYTYDVLWGRFSDSIVDKEVDIDWIRNSVSDEAYCFSTIPGPTLCEGGHVFSRQDVWITKGAWCRDNTIVYNGDPGDGWYRTSMIFGHPGTEWPFEVQQPSVKVRKPLYTDCDCLPHIYRFGRYGQWYKPVLTHDAFNQSLEVASAL